MPTARTTPDLVRGIIDAQAGVDLTPFITTANQVTTMVCGPPRSTSVYSDDGPGSVMELIERWLSAHFYTIFDNQLSRAKAGTVGVGYQFKTDLDLRASMYGQQAMMIDVDGNLAAMSNLAAVKRRVRVRMIWMGSKDLPGDISDWDIATILE